MPNETAQNLQQKYAAILNGDRSAPSVCILDSVPVLHKLKKCNLILTKTDFFCIKDDANGIECLVKLPLHSIQRSSLFGSVITISCAQSPKLQFAFMRTHYAKNQAFFQALPNAEKQLTTKQGLMVLGGGALVIGLVAMVQIMNPASYSYKTVGAGQFAADCKAELKAKIPSVVNIVESTEDPQSYSAPKGTSALYFSTPETKLARFECYPGKDWNIVGTKVFR